MPQGCVECGRPAQARGLCPAHYQRWRRAQKPPAPFVPRHCEIDGCDRQHLARGLCELHYRRWRRTGSTEVKPRPVVCSVDGCRRPHLALGLCSLHRDRKRRDEAPRCTYRGGCDRPGIRRGGICQTHERWERARAKHRDLSAEIESWKLTGLIPLDHFLQDFGRMKNMRRRRGQ